MSSATVGSAEALGQGDGPVPGSSAQIQNPAAGYICGVPPNPRGHVEQVGVQDVGIQIQQLSHRRRINPSCGPSWWWLWWWKKFVRKLC